MIRRATFSWLLAACSWLLTLSLLSACSTPRETIQPADTTAVAAGADSVIHTRAVHVLVDGKDKGIVPATVRLRRSFGTRMVSLYQKGKEIRTYELETSYTASGMQLQYSFFGNSEATSVVYDATTLPTSGENEYLIPYSPHRITIEDREFDLVLIVDE